MLLLSLLSPEVLHDSRNEEAKKAEVRRPPTQTGYVTVRKTAPCPLSGRTVVISELHVSSPVPL
jgi:hypothetical protein